MLHVPLWLVAPLMADSSYVRIDANTIVTALGNIVVADAGYPGTPPDGTTSTASWIYATSIVPVRLDTVELFPPSLTDARDLAAMVGWAQNTAAVYAQRLAAYQLDPCCRFAIATNVTRPV